MKIKASGRSALILATALFVCFSAPSQATETAEEATASVAPETVASAPIVLHTPAKRGSRHGKKHAERKPSKVVNKSSADKKSDEAAAEDAAPTAISPALANANARLASADTAPPNARAMFVQANDMPQTPSNPTDAQPAPPTDVVSADQLNDVDRELQESAPPAPTAAMAAATPDPTPAPAKPAATNSAESSAWDQTSLIGKIFIGFGALLTMASAARMFMT
jgi:hypothetical protein